MWNNSDVVYAFSMTVSYQLFSTHVWSHGCEGEDAIVQRSWVVEVLHNRTKELQELSVVRLERLWIGLQHLTQEQETNLLLNQSNTLYYIIIKMTIMLDL